MAPWPRGSGGGFGAASGGGIFGAAPSSGATHSCNPGYFDTKKGKRHTVSDTLYQNQSLGLSCAWSEKKGFTLTERVSDTLCAKNSTYIFHHLQCVQMGRGARRQRQPLRRGHGGRLRWRECLRRSTPSSPRPAPFGHSSRREKSGKCVQRHIVFDTFRVVLPPA